MKIKELQKILELAEDKYKDVYITGENGNSTTEIHWNYDDNGDLDLAEGENRE